MRAWPGAVLLRFAGTPRDRLAHPTLPAQAADPVIPVLKPLLVLLLALAGCAPRGAKRVPEESRQPLILYAVDGLEWAVLKPLVAAGRMPVFQGIMERGRFGYLESMIPTFSPVIWTSVATGKTPEKHGIHHFVYPVQNAGREELRSYTSGQRETKALWNVLSDYGLTVHCLGWWITFPAEPIHGVMVSQTNTTSVLFDEKRALWKGTLLAGVPDQVHPPERQNRVMEILAEVDSDLDSITAGIFGSFPTDFDDFSRLMWEQTRWAFRADAVYARVAEELLAEGGAFDLMAVYVGGPDVSGHRFWRYAFPEQFAHPPDAAQLDNFGRLIQDYYVYVDRTLGRLLAAAPAGTGVLVVSDHGMHSFNTERVFSTDDAPRQMNSGDHPDGPAGVFLADFAGLRRPAAPWRPAEPIDLTTLPKLGRVLDVAPTVLALKGIPVGKDLDGRVLSELIDPAWLERFPVEFVDTHDDPRWEAARLERVRDNVADDERIEQLRQLGYIK